MQQFQQYDILYNANFTLTLISHPLTQPALDLQEKSCSYQPIQHRLQQTLQVKLQQDEAAQEIKFQSRELGNSERLMHCRFNEQLKCFIWTSIDRTLQMVPHFQSRVKANLQDLQLEKKKEELDQLIKKKDLHRYVENKLKNYNFLQEFYQQQPKQELRVVPSGHLQNASSKWFSNPLESGVKELKAVTPQKFEQLFRMKE